MATKAESGIFLRFRTSRKDCGQAAMTKTNLFDVIILMAALVTAIIPLFPFTKYCSLFTFFVPSLMDAPCHKYPSDVLYPDAYISALSTMTNVLKAPG